MFDQPDRMFDPADPADEAIQKNVENAFAARGVDGAGMRVASVSHGVVLLAGTARSLAQYVELVELAFAVRGVCRVSTEVEVESSPFR